MGFFTKIDHTKLLKFALGISLFSIGYLLTMFYFQMNELKEGKERIELLSNSTMQLLQFKSAIEAESYRIQSEILNQSISNLASDDSKLTNSSFLRSSISLKDFEPKFTDKQNSIKELAAKFTKIKSELTGTKSKSTVAKFNAVDSELHLNVNQIIKDLQSEIKLCNNEYDQKINNSKTSGFLIALVSLVIFVLAYVKMNEDILKLQKINDDAIFINETLQNAEMVAGFGSWKINTVENKFIISDNLYRLLGVAPKSFEPSIEKIMSFIHPEDRGEVLKIHDKSFENEEATSSIYKIILEDGTVKHMISVGKFLNNSKGELVKIGVSQDITELMLKTKKLEENNLKLISINSELESFNNIVSHDLQEPLRKIQMFISRIESKEFLDSASEQTIQYFDKIKSASRRMQNLMMDLVDYTRTLKGDRIFEEVNLNSVFEDIIEDLALIIEEKCALISIDNLPVIVGTKFQIQQLFVNLVANALKYVKPGIAPIINVKLEQFTEDLVNGKNTSSKEYYKITVSDNGIGFEQQHANKIFLLFKRLETDESYQGTGLGLAICKKIVDNNNGLITAVGVPNEGASFAVYLPKRHL